MFLQNLYLKTIIFWEDNTIIIYFCLLDKWPHHKHGSLRDIHRGKRNTTPHQHHGRSAVLQISVPRDSHTLRVAWPVWLRARHQWILLPSWSKWIFITILLVTNSSSCPPNYGSLRLLKPLEVTNSIMQNTTLSWPGIWYIYYRLAVLYFVSFMNVSVTGYCKCSS